MPAPTTTQSPTALYIHWPFCARLCPYCDFNVHKWRRDPDAERALVDAIISDLEAQTEWAGRRTLGSVHFGGGTPSLLPAEEVERLLETAYRLHNVADGAELGLEANPEHLRPAHLADLASLGLNRVSLGVQSFHDPALRMLGREHTGAKARAAVEAALSTVPNTSVDLIYGWVADGAGQTPEQWRADLDTALDLRAPHVSAYQLTVEPGTAFERAQRRGRHRTVGGDASGTLFAMAGEVLGAAGLHPYEVSNHARPSFESRHNLAYWRGRDYFGVGPGAHGRLTVEGTRWATETPRLPRTYTLDPAPAREALEPREHALERLLLGLRTREGVEADVLASFPGWRTRVGPEWLEVVDGGTRVRATPAGRALLDSVVERVVG